MDAKCLSLALLLSSLHLTSVNVPTFNESFLGAHAYNLTCTDVAFSSTGANLSTNVSYEMFTQGGRMHCYANLSVYAYTGHVHADVEVQPSALVLASSTPDDVPWRLCTGGTVAVDTCAINASVTQMYADPPSRLVDLLLGRLQDSINSHIEPYICGVVAPEMVRDAQTEPLIPPSNRSDVSRKVFPLYKSDLMLAIVRIAGSAIFYSAQDAFLPSVTISQQYFMFNGHTKSIGAHATRSFVGAAANMTFVDWLQSLADAKQAGSLPEPLPVYGLPGTISNVTFDVSSPQLGEGHLPLSFKVEATLASCEANACELYLHPGVEVVFLTPGNDDSASWLVSNAVMPRLLPHVNAQIAAWLAALAEAQGRNSSHPDATVRVSLGNAAVLRSSPALWPAALIVAAAVVGGAAGIWRNVRRHAAQPVVYLASGSPVPALFLAGQDAVMVVGAAFCLILFASSNTMTGASVLLGDNLNTYSFSLWNTVTDLWSAGLIPLSICVFVFSGVYPYVKVLSLVYFTVCAQRPLSRRLALIDVLGKFSLIDTFALMVMVSGLEINGVAEVKLQDGFCMFLVATVASIALGNYATCLYRRGTSHRVPDEDDESALNADYAPVATQDGDGATALPVPPPPPPPAAAPAAEAAEAAPLPLWSRLRGCVSVVSCAAVLLCSLPAWGLGCLQYNVGGLARFVTPAQRTLSLWQLSWLDKQHPLTVQDPMVWAIAAVALVTILVAPCLYALLHKEAPFLASWCAADVFVVACVAGLLQLHRFVTFVLGDGMDTLYTAHATLRWPMVPLTVASLMVWFFILREVTGVAWPRKRATAATQNS